MLGSDRFNFETPNVIDPGDLPPSQPSRSQRRGGASSQQSYSSTDRSPTSSTHSVSSSSSNDSRGEYQQARSSSARLLNDINDLELSPSVPRRTYRDRATDEEEAAALRYEYGDFDRDDDDGVSASLPSVEEARSYAASLLDNAEKRLTPGGAGAAAFAASASSSSSAYNGQNGGGSGSSGKQLGLDRTIQLNAAQQPNGNDHHFNFNSRSKHLVFRQVAVLASKIFLVVILTITGVFICLALVNSRNHPRAADSNAASNNNNAAATPSVPNASPPQDQATNAEPSLTRLESIVNFLSAGQVTSVHDLTTPGSPQYMAAHWMADTDALQLNVPSHVEDDPDVFVQRYVLATLYYAMEGENWTAPLSFLSAQSECAWFEREEVVGFIDESYAIGVTCDFPALKVANIFIPSNNLKGELPSELGHLPELTMLALPMNQIQGSIPENLQYLTKLDYLDFKYNVLDGPVPDFIGKIASLEVLGLSNNKLAGDIPASSWSQLTKLKTLALDDNEFLTGSLGFANHLVHLEFFYVNGNQFSEIIDDNFLAAASQLKEVDISNNMLTSTNVFPAHLLQHPTLSVLDAAGNQLAGSLPAVLPKQNELLQFLSLRNNLLSGPITANNLPMLTALTHLDLQGNAGFTGALPDEMVNLRQLTYLFLGHNPSLSIPQLPSWLYELKELRELSMPKCNIGLGIPFWLENLQNLVLLDLSENALQGEIPAELFNLPNLRFLLLNNNNLNGVVPQNLPNVPQLMILSLHKNTGLVGDVNHVCTQAPSLQLLGVDCSTTIECATACCPTCCAADDQLCFIETIPHFMTWYDGMWEFGYKRAPFSYDPAILDESHYFSTLQDVPNTNHDADANAPAATTTNPPP